MCMQIAMSQCGESDRMAGGAWEGEEMVQQIPWGPSVGERTPHHLEAGSKQRWEHCTVWWAELVSASEFLSCPVCLLNEVWGESSSAGLGGCHRAEVQGGRFWSVTCTLCLSFIPVQVICSRGHFPITSLFLSNLKGVSSISGQP